MEPQQLNTRMQDEEYSRNVDFQECQRELNEILERHVSKAKKAQQPQEEEKQT